MGMPKTIPEADGIDSMMADLVEVARQSRDEAIEAWARGCDVYARYFAALAKSHDAEGVLSANAELMTAGMEALAKGAATVQRLNGATPPPAK